MRSLRKIRVNLYRRTPRNPIQIHAACEYDYRRRVQGAVYEVHTDAPKRGSTGETLAVSYQYRSALAELYTARQRGIYMVLSYLLRTST